MSRQKTKAERAMALRLAAVDTATRGAGAKGSARARRAGESDLSSGLRLGDGIDVVDGKMSVPTGVGIEVDRIGRMGLTAGVNMSLFRTALRDLTTSQVVETLADPVSSVGTGSIAVDIPNKWITLEAGGVYSIDGAAVQHEISVRLDRVDELTAAPPTYTDIWSHLSIDSQTGASEESISNFPLVAILDLRGLIVPVGLRVVCWSNITTSTPRVRVNLKIVRIL